MSLNGEDKKPVIMTRWGPVTEAARLQAALNMKADPEKKRQVEEILVRRYGLAKGLIEAKRRYPEAYEE